MVRDLEEIGLMCSPPGARDLNRRNFSKSGTKKFFFQKIVLTFFSYSTPHLMTFSSKQQPVTLRGCCAIDPSRSSKSAHPCGRPGRCTLRPPRCTPTAPSCVRRPGRCRGRPGRCRGRPACFRIFFSVHFFTPKVEEEVREGHVQCREPLKSEKKIMAKRRCTQHWAQKWAPWVPLNSSRTPHAT